MYPNSICGFNIFADCMIGKLYIADECQVYKTYDEDAGKEYIEDMISLLPLHTGTKWFGLPDFMELNDIIREELNVDYE